MASVSLRNVTKTSPGNLAAGRDLSLEIPARELVVLVGPPGSGKTAVLRLLAGLDRAASGEIFIEDKRVNEVTPKDRDIGMVFRDDALYPQMSVFGNLAFGLQLRKYSKEEIKRRVVDAAGVLGIQNLLERKRKELSPEERRRVAIGRAIVRQPKVLLFDEPFAGLTGEVRRQLRSEIIKLQQRLSATLICALADPVEAMAMGDRLVVLKDGGVEQNDIPLMVYDEPANLFVAKFMGPSPMNLISGALKAEGDKIRFVESEGGTIDLSFAAEARPAARDFIGKPVILGIRPEDLIATTFNRQEARARGNGFPAVVDLVEPLGAEANLYLETGAHSLVGRSRRGLDRREAGHRFQFEIEMTKAHFFDPVSTSRIG